MKIGEFNDLTVLRFTTVGAYLGDEQENDVLLPNKYLSEDLAVGDVLKVFVYRDSEDRAVATTEIPLIELNTFAYLKVTAVDFFGAFADWGLEKELMIPFREQNKKLETGQYCLVYLLLDEQTDRVYGSTKVNRYLEPCERQFDANKPVHLMICDTTELGVKVIVNERYSGLIFLSDVNRPLQRGERTSGYVYNVREDGKLDVRLEMDGYDKISDSAERLLELIRQSGKLKLTDKSDPDEIREAVGMSKKTFKQSVGALYRKRLIRLEEDGIYLVTD
ncbi:MAG: GntR family transcriptional regulator [Bacteroidetes bacterium RIFCSPHIGHO2_02_FULL_44_7]|nr:MAG: GntR family transcriptional regulator [Bacteroidetes bacterium RIFCSPHIGHO2_02_FULL_44_7]